MADYIMIIITITYPKSFYLFIKGDINNSLYLTCDISKIK